MGFSVVTSMDKCLMNGGSSAMQIWGDGPRPNNDCYLIFTNPPECKFRIFWLTYKIKKCNPFDTLEFMNWDPLLSKEYYIG